MCELDFSKPIIKIEKFVKTTDNWYPNFPNKKVRIRLFFTNYYSDIFNKWIRYIRCCVWGNDDFGLEKDFECFSKEELINKFWEVKSEIYDKIPNIVNQKYFYNLGFINA